MAASVRATDNLWPWYLQEDWGLFMITKKRSIKLKMTEFDETFGDEHAPGTQVGTAPGFSLCLSLRSPLYINTLFYYFSALGN